MIKKYSVISCLSLTAVFVILYSFDAGETKPAGSFKASSVAQKTDRTEKTSLATGDDMIAAILIMPKSYLPALKRFSKSKMAKHIKIYQAQLELKNGEMTATHKMKTAKKRDRNISRKATLERRSVDETQIIAAGILYLMANSKKYRLYR